MRPWQQACLALELLAAEPRLGGIWLRARCGPVRDTFLAALPTAARKIHPHITDEQLFGGIDLSATLATSSVVRTKGILESGQWMVLPMAERCSPGLAARLGSAIDEGAVVIALDERVDPDEEFPSSLADRMAFWIDLDGVRLADVSPPRSKPPAQGPGPDISHADRERLVQTAAAFGVSSARKLYHGELTARACAAREGAQSLTDAHIFQALEMVIAPAATQLPAPETPSEHKEEEPPPPQEPEQTAHNEPQVKPEEDILEEILVEALKAALPPNLIEKIKNTGVRRRLSDASGSGAKQQGNRRGRPLPSRAGTPGSGQRIDLVATLRAAVPWQPLRKKARQREERDPSASRVEIQRSDIRIKRFESRSDNLIVFAVDASGSSAMARLGEAKGAIEFLLSEAYVRRDHVALVVFRGEQATLLLAPTRSLVQTKRRLASQSGGGGTPLASGLKVSAEIALQARSKGMTPIIALLTDGRANITLGGEINRADATADAQAMARQIRAQGIQTLVIDTGVRPTPALQALAQTIDGSYMALPRANARRLSDTIKAACA